MKNLKKKIKTVFTALFIAMANTSLVFADDNAITSSKPFQGLKKMLEDATTALLVIVPIAGVLLYIYFNARKGAADEMDHKVWDKRKNVLLISIVSAFIATAVINLIVSYVK